jgi:hypothetical protein
MPFKAEYSNEGEKLTAAIARLITTELFSSDVSVCHAAVK